MKKEKEKKWKKKKEEKNCCRSYVPLRPNGIWGGYIDERDKEWFRVCACVYMTTYIHIHS